MDNRMRMFYYNVLIIVVSVLLVIHVFNIYTLNVDKFSFFIVSLFFLLLILPVVGQITMPGVARIVPRRSVLSKK